MRKFEISISIPQKIMKKKKMELKTEKQPPPLHHFASLPPIHCPFEKERDFPPISPSKSRPTSARTLLECHPPPFSTSISLKPLDRRSFVMPPESRDRLVRAVDVAAAYSRRRAGILGVLEDEPERSSNLFEPVVARRLAGAAGARAMAGLGRGGAIGRAVLGTPRNVSGRGRNLFATPLVGRENTPAGSARRGPGRPDSVLPSWYPRTPLRDITSVVRAYGRRRARLSEIEGRQADTPVAMELTIGESSVPRMRAPLEHDVSLYTPGPAVAEKPCPLSVGKVPKILLDITKQTCAGDSEFLTPQKKLLNQIDTVEKVVMHELRRLKRTPSAKKAERQKRVRTLMSMR